MKPIRLLWLASLFCSSASFGGHDQTNVVVIMADDIGFECYGTSGSQFYSTPNIDRLASTGAKFTQAYSQPICTPSRIRIMTGRYNFRNYTRFGELDLSQPTFATMVRANGYATAIAGKWQLSKANLAGPQQAGFDEYCLWHFSGGLPRDLPRGFRNKGSRYKSPRLFENGVLLEDMQGKYGPDIVSDFLCDFMERNVEKPFLVYYPMILVHNPFDPTPDSRDWEKRDRDRQPLDHFREMVHYMDKVIGKVVDKLEELGLREQTLVLITGDNGTNRSLTSPFPGRGFIRGGKGTMQDAGNRVAFVANWPGVIEPETVVDSPIALSDVLPTIADVTDSEMPEGIDGETMLPLLMGDTKSARGWIFQSYSKDGPGKAPYRCFVRDDQWKLYADGSLFHVPSDWLEEAPITDEKGRAARSRLQPVLDRILQEIPDSRLDRGPYFSKAETTSLPTELPPGAGDMPTAATTASGQTMQVRQGSGTDVFRAGADGYNVFRIPALVQAANGDLLAFCEARQGGDASEIDLVLKRSTDFGLSWGPLQVVQESDHFRHLYGANPPPITVGNPAPVVDRLDPQHAGRIWLPFTIENDRVFVCHSDDHGRRWSEPREITVDVKRENWGWYATGPVHSIQLQRGPHRGRLVVPADHRLGVAGSDRGPLGAQLILSDDHGKTWRLGAVDESYEDGLNANETTLAELYDGRLYINTRDQHGDAPGTRGEAWSLDGGATFDAQHADWSSFRPSDKILDPPVVQGALLSFGRDMLIFCGPDSDGPSGSGRSDLRIRYSRDSAETWQDGPLVHVGPAAYSDLVKLSSTSIGILFESGELGQKSAYQRIAFAHIDIR